MRRRTAVKHLLKRGALVSAANWPVVVVQAVADALFKALLAVPVVGGVALVVLLVGSPPADFLTLEPRAIVPTLAAVLLAHPTAFAAFAVSLLVVLVGGSGLMFLVKGGTVTVLCAGESAAGAIEHPPLRVAAIRRAGQFSLERFTAGAELMFRRYVRLGFCLGLVYAVSVGGYLAFVLGTPAGSAEDWTAWAALASTLLVAWITLVNFVYLLFQIVMATDGVGVRTAAPRVAGFLRSQTVVVGLILAATLALVLLTMAASIMATAAFGLIAFVPFVGLAALPLQLVAWLVRGLVLDYVALTALVAYLRLYRTTRGAAAGTVEAMNRIA